MKFLSLIVLSISVLISVTSCKKQETSLSQADIEKIAKEVAKYSQAQGVTSGETVEKLKEEAQALIDQDQTLTQEEKTKAKEVAREDFEKIEEKAQDLIGSSSWEKKREELLKAQDKARDTLQDDTSSGWERKQRRKEPTQNKAIAETRTSAKTQLNNLLQSSIAIFKNARNSVKNSVLGRYAEKNRNTPCKKGHIEGEYLSDGSKICWIIRKLPQEYKKGPVVDCYSTHAQFGGNTCKRAPCPSDQSWDGRLELCVQKPLNIHG